MPAALIAAPPHRLASSCAPPKGLSRLEVEVDEEDMGPDGLPTAEVLERLTASLGCTDVTDAFHQLNMPEELMWYFCVGEALGEELGLPLGETFELFWASLPTGFTWSLYFCQAAAEYGDQGSSATRVLYTSAGFSPSSGERYSLLCFTMTRSV